MGKEQTQRNVDGHGQVIDGQGFNKIGYVGIHSDMGYGLISQQRQFHQSSMPNETSNHHFNNPFITLLYYYTDTPTYTIFQYPFNMQAEHSPGPKPKSIRQIREMRKREPKLVEGAKNTLIIRGSKTSEMTTQFLKDIKSLKKETSTFYSRRNDTHPFDKVDDIQHYCKSTDSSLFLFGSNSKKRPNNIVIGRLFEYTILDMVEFGIDSIAGIEEFATLLKVPTHTRPVIIFQGDSWETDSTLSRVKNILHDFFVENAKVNQLQINNAMRLTLTFSAYGNKVSMRTFEVLMSGNVLEDDGKTSIEEVGPKVDFTLRRTRFADDEIWKLATKIPKTGGKKEDKNIIRDNMGNKRGKLFVDRQNLDNLGLRKTKALDKKEKFEAKVKEMRSYEGGAQQFQA